MIRRALLRSLLALVLLAWIVPMIPPLQAQSTVIGFPNALRTATSQLRSTTNTNVRSSATGQIRQLERRLQQLAPEQFDGDWTAEQLTDFLNEQSIPTVLHRTALEQAGHSPDTAIHIRNIGQSIGSTLSTALREHHLGWTMARTLDAVVITSDSEVEEAVITMVYDISRLGLAGKEAIEVITRSVAPNSWDDVGGPGSISAIDSHRQLIVSNNYHVHVATRRLLAAIAQRAKRTPGGFAARPPTSSRHSPPPTATIGSTVVQLPSRAKPRGIAVRGKNSTSGFGSFGGGMGGGMF